MYKRQRKINIAKQKQIKSLAMLKQEAEALPRNRDFPLEKALTKQDINFICEVKKASPSKGIIAQDFPYLTIAKEYELAGASAISVLTEPDYFLGEDKYLQEDVYKRQGHRMFDKYYVLFPYRFCH